MRHVILVLVVVFPTWCLPEKPSGPIVQTKSGKIHGHYLTSYKGNQYEAYQGIPFTLPPTGERRFQSPVPIVPWSNDLQATKLKEICLQDFPPHLNMPVTGSEDCLYLNVYVPTKRKTNDKLPVIFYIHGGAFRSGGASDGQEEYIIDHDVIYVSTQYRLGVLGFLSTEDDVVPGNMALKDQSTALKWVYENIEYFGGDPKRITLVGGSAAAICIHLHYLSPWSRGLFHAGISISGSAFVPAAVTESSRDRAVALGRLVNCTDTDIKQLVKCLKKVTAEALVDAQNKMQVWQNVPVLFGPVVEKSSPDPFVNDYPSEILKKGKAYDAPWITGTVAEEGLVFTAGYTQNDTLKYINENWDSLAPAILEYLYTIPKDQYVNVSRKIRGHYFGEKPIDRQSLHALTKLIGDRMFSVGAVNAARAQASVNKSPVFFYYYDYRSMDSLSDVDSKSTENLGVAHGDDVHLVVKDSRISPTKSTMDMDMQRRLIQIWTSVAYNGVPNVGFEWPKVANENKSCLDYLHLAGPYSIKAECGDNLAQHQFWNSIDFSEK